MPIDTAAVREIKILSKENDVNRYIANGWKLLLSAQYTDKADGIAYPCFTVGWDSDSEPTHPASSWKPLS